MANFQKFGKNVNGQVLKASPGKVFELGLWGPIDTRTMTELDVSIRPPNPAVSIVRAGMLPGQNVRIWRFSGLPAGLTLVEAKDSGGLVWTSVTIDTTSNASAGGRKYTDNPNEVLTQRTTPTPLQVVNMLLEGWDKLTNNGARTLTAQFMAETGGGRYCFNWNLGNVKSGPDQSHMYLRGVWEVDSPDGAQAQVVRANGLAHIATADEIKKHGWPLPAGKAIAVFDPPHPQCRFRAYDSLQDGSQRWLGHHKAIALKKAGFIEALNAGDIAAVAKALKQTGYYTASEASYARAMTRTKAEVDRVLGALP
ncbi:MAG TPA: hypothetical protein VIE65_02170 [Methylobacter sp.]|jgi:hypothetical protein